MPFSHETALPKQAEFNRPMSGIISWKRIIIKILSSIGIARTMQETH